MTPRWLLTAVTVSVVVLAATLIFKPVDIAFFTGTQNKVSAPANLEQALDLSPRIAQYHLYSGAVSAVTGQPLVPADRKVDLFDAGGAMPSASYATNKDHSSEASRFTTGGALDVMSSFYPDEDGIERLHVRSRYFSGEKLKDEDIRHLDGTREKQTTVDESGKNHVIQYADDGETVLDDKVSVPNSCCKDLIVQSEMRYREGPTHLLKYSNVLNADNTRSIAEFDENQNQIRSEVRPADGKTEGAVIIVLNPKTLRRRLVSRTKGEWDTIDYLRSDDTVERQVKINDVSVEIRYFDMTGNKVLFLQKWGMVWSDGVSHRFLSDVFEFDDHGNRVRDLMFQYDPKFLNDARMMLEIRYDTVFDGVKYERASFGYDENGFLTKTRYMLKGTDDLDWLSHKPDRGFENTPADKIVAVMPQFEESPLDLDPTLPVPPPAPHYGH